jgi:uncharacterized membrane protein YkoI
MKRAALLVAIALTAGLPGMAEAQGRGRGQDRDERPRENSLGADWRPQQEEARQGVRQGRMVPLQSIAPRLNRRAPGRLLDAGIENHGGQKLYRVRWQAADGRRIDYLVDAATGAVVGAQGE